MNEQEGCSLSNIIILLTIVKRLWSKQFSISDFTNEQFKIIFCSSSLYCNKVSKTNMCSWYVERINFKIDEPFHCHCTKLLPRSLISSVNSPWRHIDDTNWQSIRVGQRKFIINYKISISKLWRELCGEKWQSTDSEVYLTVCLLKKNGKSP